MAAPYGSPYDLGGGVSGSGQTIQFGYNSGVRLLNMHPRLTYLTAEDNQIFPLLPETSFENISPRWLQSTLAAIDTGNAWTDGSDFTFGDPNLPVHREQTCRVQRASVKLSNAMIQEQTFKALQSNWAYQKDIALRQLRRDQTWAIYNGGMVNTDENAARRFRGLFASANNASNSTTGAFAEATFKGTVLKGIYDDNFTPTDVIVHPLTQLEIDALTASNTKWIPAKENEIVSYLNTYDTPYGRVKIHQERADYFAAASAATVAPDYVYTTGAKGLMYAFDRSQFNVGYFRKTQMFEPSPRGDYREWIIQSDWAPQDMAAQASFLWTNIS